MKVRIVILTFIILLVGHYFLIPYIESSKFYNFSFQNRNISRFQNIIYENNQNYDLILFGSSMSASLNTKVLQENSINLSAEGETIFSGIKVANYTKMTSKTYLIEVNALYRTDLNRLTDIVLNPVKFQLRKHVEQFRETNRPDNLLANLIMRVEDKLKFKPYSNKSKLFEGRVKDFEFLNDSSIVSSNIYRLEKFIKDNFKNEIIFYELPFDSGLESSVKAVYVRNKAKDLAIEHELLYIDIPDSINFDSPDYIHLSPVSMRKYEAFLKNKLR